jgi:outer membrane protein assembly factor BamD (BamD/ComL family)
MIRNFIKNELMGEVRTMGRPIVFCALVILAAVIVSGCGKSADDLYAEGKSLVAVPATLDKGLETLDAFAKKFPKDPRAPETLLAIATISQNEKRFPAAEAAYTRIIDKYPGTTGAYKARFLIAYMYSEDMNDLQKAKAAFTAFIEAYPDSELTVSAKVLLENLGKPVEEWSAVQKINADRETAPAAGAKK